ncbi:MAG: Na+:solute symporter [Deltaproteobacteria bacterium]|nr:Na+:solute symporter [Deltaproteobacteria bacterium]
MPALDWSIVIAYLVIAVGVGAFFARKASESTASFFAAGRTLPWWIAGTSMVATTFAADTPLAVTGIVAAKGVAGNWFWWNLAIAHVFAAVYLARLWRRSEVLTDAGIIESRYSGKPAATLRAFKAFFFAVPINCITMGWVILAMRKILGVFVDWEAILPAGWFEAVVALWPAGNQVDPQTGLSVLFAMVLAVGYSVLGGFRGVVITDLIQFSLAMIGSVAVAVLAVREVGGLGELMTKLEATTGDAAGLTAWVPASDSEWMPLHLFGVYVLILWWAQKYSDAGGYLMQRMAACKDARHAAGATLWFTACHYVVRTWPWLLAGLAALVLYPVAENAGLDRETTYPMLIRDLLPTGLLGIAVASLIAAFMSTIDTHVNWGASYLVTDLYQRFLKKDASERHYVAASRWAVVIMAVIAAIFALNMNSIADAWVFFVTLGSGLGLVALARWLWWRVSAWSELAALGATLLVTLVLYLPGVPELGEAARVLVTVSFSTTIWVTVTFLTPPTDDATLDAFYRKVRPLGFWGPVRARCPDVDLTERKWDVALGWATGVAFVYLLLFGFGELFLGSTGLGLVLLVLGVVCGWLTYRVIVDGRLPFGPRATSPASSG